MAYVAFKGVFGALFGEGWKSVALGLLLVVIGLSGYTWFLRQHTITRDVAQQLKEANNRSKVVGVAVHAVSDKSRKTTERLNHVLEVHKDWSEQPVPDAIVDELCHKVTCTKDTRPVHSSGGQPVNSRWSGKGDKRIP